MVEIIFNTEKRLIELSEYNKEEVWYIVKQEMEFWKVCYAVYIVKQYQNLDEQMENLETFFKKKAQEIKEQKGFDNFITTHRMLLLGYMLGLMIKVDSQYKNAKISDVFKVIEKRCNGSFENVELYYDILERQIEKVYFSSILDEKRNTTRSKYRLYPLFLLYKVLVEIGKITGRYYITQKEFVVFVCTTEKYDDYLDTVFNILNCRNNTGLRENLNKLNSNLRSDVRYHKLLVSLKTIEETDDGLAIKPGLENYVKEKLYLYETSNIVSDINYIEILNSTDSLIKKKDNIDENKNEHEMEYIMDIKNIDKNEVDNKISRNLIVYGAPGTGKSNKLEKEYRERFFNNEYLYSRVTFNPNYTYSDFIGVYKPTPIYIKDNNDNKEYYKANKIDLLEKQMLPAIDYGFVCGPFIDMLCRALNDEEHNYLILIEEINRADVSSVFGDVFQLLDRDENNNSKYGIRFNKDIMDYIASSVHRKSECFIKDELVKIPSNLYIWATMNSADQNVIKMDTAFKRRWDFDYVSLDKYKDGANDLYIKLNFMDKYILWNDFREVLNKYLSEVIEIVEDKLIGPYFINDFVEENGVKVLRESAVKYKLFSYLKEDVLRYNSTELFKENYTFSKLIEEYEKNNSIFIDDFARKIAAKVNNDEN